MSKLNQDITLEEIQKIVQDSSAIKVINSLIEKGLVSVYENLNEHYKAKKEDYIFLNSEFSSEDALRNLFEKLDKIPKQMQLLLTFLHLQQTETEVLKSKLLQQAEVSGAVLKGLLDKGILELRKVEVDRIQFDRVTERVENTLSNDQQEAYEVISKGFEQNKPILLKGITGSGKTHIYFKLIEDCIKQGKQALYLLPEIALTAQIIRKLRSVFGDRIGVYHSRFSNHERVELWKNIQNGKYDIIIGARSALLLPFSNLGLIVVDEEHDNSYKQTDPAPRYHARDAAIYLALQFKANIVLGTATPSVESYYNCKQGKYQLVELTNRYGNAELPKVELIDSKQQMAEKKQHGIFSTTLIDAIQESLLHKKQVIIFQNRRGYSPFMMCASCGWVPQCKYCDVSLTYHKLTDQLHCHYCNSKSPYIKICPACGGNQIQAKSFGTEKVEEELKTIFPNARVQRFDWDAMRIKNKYNEIIRQFERQEIDILVGTQMVVKGLDFEHVNLVGVLSADSLLSYPDFRVNEKTFQLLEQVSGRAGRTDDKGKVLIQLFKLNHPVILDVMNHDFKHFYETEIESRKEFLYPPFTRLIKIVVKHTRAEIAWEAALKLSEQLSGLSKTAMFGPAEPPVSRIKNYYIQEILLKINRDVTHLQQIKREIKQHVTLLTTTKNFTTVRVQIDVDPY